LPPESASAETFLQHQLDAVSGVLDIWAATVLRLIPLTDDGARSFELWLTQYVDALFKKTLSARGASRSPQALASEVRMRLDQRTQYWVGHVLRMVREFKEEQRAKAAAADTDNPIAMEEEAAPPAEKIRKRGPQRDYETALRVAEIVARLAPDGNWRARVEDICDELDDAEVRRPKPWKAKGYPTWYDCCVGERGLVIKAIEHHMELAQEHKRTFS
jgi:hypothetical protein